MKKIILISILALMFLGFFSLINAQVSGYAGYTFTRSLKVGSQGEDVKALQQYLISRGYEIPSAQAGNYGYFGSQTRDALIKFQNDNPSILSCAGITSGTGTFGPCTQNNINSDLAFLPLQDGSNLSDFAYLPPNVLLPSTNNNSGNSVIPNPSTNTNNNSYTPGTSGPGVAPGGTSVSPCLAGTINGLRIVEANGTHQKNETMRRLGYSPATEPYSRTLVDRFGTPFVGGLVSSFGGGRDTDAKNNDPLAIHSKCSASQLNIVNENYMAYRWDYYNNGNSPGTTKTQLLKSYACFYNPKNGKYTLAIPVDWGPSPNLARSSVSYYGSGPSIDVSYGVLAALGDDPSHPVSNFSPLFFNLVPATGQISLKCEM